MSEPHAGLAGDGAVIARGALAFRRSEVAGMRVRLTVLGWDLVDLATGRDVVDTDPDAIGAVYGAGMADNGYAGRTFGFAPNDEPLVQDV